MVIKDFYFSINLDPVVRDKETLYIPQIYFGDQLVWTGDCGYTDRKVATTAAEGRLMEMMEVVFNPEQVSATRVAAYS